MEKFRKSVYSIITILALIFCLFPATQATAQDTVEIGEPGNVSLQNELTGTFSHIDLKMSHTLWADGKVKKTIEHAIENVDIEGFTGLTWGFSNGPDVYSEIRAWDIYGPLTVTTTPNSNGISVRVNFRNTVPISRIYRYFFSITIEGLATGSGTNWNYQTSFYSCCTVQTFIQRYYFPSNAKLTSVSPTPTYATDNYVEYIKTNYMGGESYDFSYTLSYDVNVPYYSQLNPQWRYDPYGNYGSNDTVNTVGKWGCNLTSAAMIVDYWGQRSTPVFRTDPEKLNDWLRSHAGYNQDNGVIHEKVQEYAIANKVNLSFRGRIYTPNNQLVDSYLLSGNPVMLGVKKIWSEKQKAWIPGHFVVVTGKTMINGVETYKINDPAHGQTTLYEKWGNLYYAIRLYAGGEADPSRMYISAHSPVELLVTDPIGRKFGYDSRTDTHWNEIPGAVYHSETISAEDGTEDQLPEYLVIEIPTPLEGKYLIEVLGTGVGPYLISTVATDWQGGATQTTFSGNAELGSSQSNSINYSLTTGLYSYVYLPFVHR